MAAVQADYLVNLATLSQIIAQRLGRDSIPTATLARWRQDALIEPGTRLFTARDIDKIMFIALQLQRNRSRTRAVEELVKYLEQKEKDNGLN